MPNTTGVSNISQPIHETDEQILMQVCEEKGIPIELIKQLRSVEEKYSGMGRRHGLANEMRDLIAKAMDQMRERRE